MAEGVIKTRDFAYEVPASVKPGAMVTNADSAPHTLTVQDESGWALGFRGPASVVRAGCLQLISLAATAPSSRFGQNRPIRLTHEQLAGLLGATREATSKTLADLAAKGIIRQGRGRITIQNLAALRAAAANTP